MNNSTSSNKRSEQQGAQSRCAQAGTAARFVTSAFWRMMPAGMRRRWWMFRPLDLVAKYWPRFKKPSGVLVVRMDGIGDMVLFRQALDAYADVFDTEKSKITVLGCASWGSIAEKVFKDYQLLIIDEHAFARQPFYRFSIALKVRALAPKIAICDAYFRRALMADSLIWMATAERSIVSLPYVNEATRVEFTYYLSQVDEIIDTGPYPTHEIVRHYQFISTIAGRDVTPKPPVINWTKGQSIKPVSGPYAVLNPGSNEFGRRWPIDDYFQLADVLLAAGLKVVFTGKAQERAPSKSFCKVASHPGVIDMTGKTDLAGLLDLMQSAALVVSNDTGPAHLSVALGAPTVVIVGGGHFGSFVPYPKTAMPDNARFVFKEMSCYHCFWRCPKRDSKFDVFPCVSAVTLKTVTDACVDLGAIKDKQIS